ncbi:predicted protein, partial [Nematostella vectensis]
SIVDHPIIIFVGNEIVSDLPLQMALYFNVYFSPFWFLTAFVILAAKYDKLDFYYKFVLIAIYIVMAIVESTRLYLGYLGNLHEKVPELAGFWLLTLVLQFPLTLVLLLNESMLIMPTERAMNILMTIFVLVEIIQGYRVIKALADHQVSKFHLHQFDEVSEMQDIQERGPEEIGFR